MIQDSSILRFSPCHRLAGNPPNGKALVLKNKKKALDWDHLLRVNYLHRYSTARPAEKENLREGVKRTTGVQETSHLCLETSVCVCERVLLILYYFFFS